jgi:hypothetical protein
MEANLAIPDLKRKLLAEVRTLFQPNGSAWKVPILQVLQDLKQADVQAVLFGGTLRSLLVSRLFEGRLGRPRDIDVVVLGAPLSELTNRFHGIVARHTRFGGLKLRNGHWHFDVWPLEETWAFRKDKAVARFEDLPSTTTFNLEAIAVEVWSKDRKPRALFSGHDQFFDGILSKTLELNRMDSPFPELAVVRAVIMASELRFKIGPCLAAYIAEIATTLSEEDIDEIQANHYGYSRITGHTLKQIMQVISRRSPMQKSIELPRMGQLHLWEAEPDTVPHITFHFLGV